MYTTITGRVARAGRSGTAYSFVSSDEVPYMIDLHLFLGRSLATSGNDGLYIIHVYTYTLYITRLLYTCKLPNKITLHVHCIWEYKSFIHVHVHHVHVHVWSPR